MTSPSLSPADLTTLRDAVYAFWFQGKPDQMNPAWFTKDPAFDAAITDRFATAVAAAASGSADALADHATGAVALCILLDQFPRNMFRGSAQAFATDGKALAIAQGAIARGFDRTLPLAQKMFLYLPYEHSEDPARQADSLRLFGATGDETLIHYAQAHAGIIQRFGRYPHRNAALGRSTTADEAEFLTQPGSSF